MKKFINRIRDSYVNDGKYILRFILKLNKRIWDETGKLGHGSFVKIGTLIIFWMEMVFALILTVCRFCFPHDWLINEMLKEYFFKGALPVLAIWFVGFYDGSTFLIYLKKKKAAKAALEAAEKEEDSG